MKRVSVYTNVSKIPREPNDPVLESAIVNGLSLVKSTQQKGVKSFITYFVKSLLKSENFDPKHPLYDPCSPLRALRAVQQLCSSGYGDFFQIDVGLFELLLKSKDKGIADAAAITLLSHSSRVQFNTQTWAILRNYLFIRALKFEFSSAVLNSFSASIYKGISGDGE